MTATLVHDCGSIIVWSILNSMTEKSTIFYKGELHSHMKNVWTLNNKAMASLSICHMRFCFAFGWQPCYLNLVELVGNIYSKKLILYNIQENF